MSAREDYIAGLRALADLLAQHDDLPLPLDGQEHTSIGWNLLSDTDARDAAAEVIRSVGGSWDKVPIGTQMHYRRKLHGLHLHVVVTREAVCERVVTGTETVTRLVPAPDAPMVEVTETVETVEWVCQPLLAERAS